MDESDMWGQVEWMKPADLEILNFLANPKREHRPGDIARNIGFSTTYTRKRCKVLSEHGLLDADQTGHPYYKITELGERVVRRDVDAEELVEDEPSE
jgi:DNA-binding IclR family transcriptional regulator